MGVRLLTRTTRSVAPTEAGERLLQTIGPRFQDIEHELAALTELRDKPAGTIRITATDYATNKALWPRLAKVLTQYPDLKVEIVIDYGLVDIVEQRFDIGVRLGDQVAKDMIAVRIAPDMKMAIVGSPSYLTNREAPRSPADLTAHNCIGLRLPTHGGVYAWELKKGKRELQVRIDGQLTCNGSYQMLRAAIDGVGLAFLPDDMVAEHANAGQLVRVLEPWCSTFPGLHIFYANRREMSRAMSVVIDALRYRA
ncbi:LysR family transcriptional regulator [Dyella terrae]|nr:LysR family transcriptional regulator [Dyella terrae]